MPSLRAWGQGSGAPAHLQLVQRPNGMTCGAPVCAGRRARHLRWYSDDDELFRVLERSSRSKCPPSDLSLTFHRPAGTGLCERLEPVITNLARAKAKNFERRQRPAGILCRWLDRLGITPTKEWHMAIALSTCSPEENGSVRTGVVRSDAGRSCAGRLEGIEL